MTGPQRSKGTNRYLLPDERAVIETRRHWMILMPPVLKSLAIIVVALFFLSNDPRSMALDNIVILTILAVLLYLTYQITQWWLDHFVVTNRRVLLVSGVLTKRTAIMPLMKVTDLTFEQSPLGRMLQYGTFVFESAGQDQALSRVTHLPGGPRQLYLQITDLLFATYTGPPMPAQMRFSEGPSMDAETGRMPGVGQPRVHRTTPIPRLDPHQGPFAAGREGDD
ncbi:MAG: PH domain-containing protein [Actinomycetota bacterium]|nr:PH domain-containing protein [Actinomycetota bacterium]